jgi:hypothetical protein
MGPILLSAILAASKAMRKQVRRFFKAKGTGEVSNTVMFNTMFYSFMIECSCVCVLLCVCVFYCVCAYWILLEFNGV